MAREVYSIAKKAWTKPELKRMSAGSAENGNKTSADKNGFS